ncbi:hypothetical protein NE865_07434 [Phthorimaea operculella]|nr:hypothetical protein NE865_07434 [Phthorimaea operculella]
MSRLGIRSGRARIARMRGRALIYLWIFIIALLFGLYVFTLIKRIRCTELYSITKDNLRHYLRVPDDVTCYYSSEKQVDELKHIKKNAIYLISASCESSLSLHHACVIESVVHTHGYDKKVYVFFNTPVKTCACSEAFLKGLKALPSLQFVTIQIDKFVEDTPLKGIFGKNFFKYGRGKHSRVVEYLKLAVLYKFGGTIIDLDMIMAKPISYLGLNWAVRVNASQLGSAAMALTKKAKIGHSLLTRSIEIVKEQRYQLEVDAGLALTQAFRELCYNAAPVLGCSGFKIYDEALFYPFNKSSSHLMFSKGHLQAKAFGYYVWDPTKIRRNRGSVYVQLTREYCPNLPSYYQV